MGNPTGFIEIARKSIPLRPVGERIGDWNEVTRQRPDFEIEEQSARCMDCGIPFCHSGCPLGNLIPEFNQAVYDGRWHEAWLRLRETNNFPEFTGRICPAPCESACVAGLASEPVAIEQIELAISERAHREGWLKPVPPMSRTGKSVAVVGSGPAGLACADQLNQAGHSVTVFERHGRPGGLLRYGIPDFKLDKGVVDRRIAVMEQEGVTFRCGVEVGENLDANALAEAFDAVVMCVGSTTPRDLPVDGRALRGVHFAWEFLAGQNRTVSGESARPEIHAGGKHVVVIGGGDTGSDCVGTSNRHGAASVTQFELLDQPPGQRPAHQPWPLMPMLLKTTSSHEEGADRRWAIMTTAFEGNGRVEGLQTVEVTWSGGRPVAVEGTERQWPADLVLLAMGYTGPSRQLADAFDLQLDPRKNLLTDDCYRTSRPGVYAAGDASRGQSLVVWAIAEGREAAYHVDRDLMGASALARRGAGDLPRAPR